MDCSFLAGDVAKLPLVIQCDQTKTGALRIATPFQYPNGEHIDLFIESEPSLLKEIRLSDHGHTIAYLVDAGVKPWSTKRRNALVDEICRSLDVIRAGDQFLVRVPDGATNKIPDAIARLAQACIRTCDIIFTARSSTATAFKENFEEFLVDSEIPYEPDVELVGGLGENNIVPVDFRVIGKTVQSLVLLVSGSNPASVTSGAINTFKKFFDLEQGGLRRSNQFLAILDSESPAIDPVAMTRLGKLSEIAPFPAASDDVRAMLAA